MNVQKRWGFGFGTIFSLIVVYFIYLYSKDKGWALLTFISKWYLIIAGGFLALSLGIIVLVLLFSLVVFLIAIIRLSLFRRKQRKKDKDYIDVEYQFKE